MADEKVNMGPEENKTPENQSPPGQGDLPPLEENNAPAVSGEDKAAPDHVEPDPPSADKHTQQTVLPGMGEDTPAPSGKSRKSAGAVPRKSRLRCLRGKRRKRRSPAQAARLRLTRRPVRRPRPLFGTKCPEVRKLTRARKRAPAVRLCLNPLRR